MNRKGFGLIEVLIAVVIVALLAGGGLYIKNIQNQQATLQTGLNAEKQAQQVVQQVNEQTAQEQGILNQTIAGASSVPSISGWQTYTDPSSGISFSFPSLGTSTAIGVNDTNFPLRYIIGAVDPADFNQPVPVIEITILQNLSRGDLQTWFESNVDDASGTLLTSGAFQFEKLQNGEVLVDSNPIPASYQGGPVADGYMLSASGDSVYVIGQSQDGQLTDFGYPSSSIVETLMKILVSIHVVSNQ